jgi:hypothetical protein
VLGPDGAYYHHQQLHVGAHAVDDQHQAGDMSNLDTGGTWHQQRAPSLQRRLVSCEQGWCCPSYVAMAGTVLAPERPRCTAQLA